jgi:hypothetical protein
MRIEMTRNAISLSTLLGFYQSALARFPDRRTGNNTQYDMQDIGMAAFSVFFTQNPSFLAHQQAMRQRNGKSNAKSLFGIREIPSDNHIRQSLDPVSPEYVFPVFDEVLEALERSDLLSTLRWYNGDILVPLDGTRYFSSKEISCPNCSTITHQNGTITYFHSVITPVIVTPGRNMAISLTPEFIVPQDGVEKQDCETNAGKRWLDKHGDRLKAIGVTILGDDLYSRQPMCEMVLSKGLNFIFVCKPDSHKSLYGWVELLEQEGDLDIIVVRRWNGKYSEIYTYKYANDVPLRDSDDALLVNWVKLTIAKDDGEILYRNAFVTNHPITNRNVEEIVSGGRARWKVESAPQSHGRRFSMN